jgi:hypothetical protein
MIYVNTLNCTYSDPEDYRGIVATTSGRDLVMALYIAPLVDSIGISNVVKSGTNIVITWGSASGGIYSVLRTNNVKAYTTNWPVIVTGIAGTGGNISYTDTTATASMNVYRVSGF